MDLIFRQVHIILWLSFCQVGKNINVEPWEDLQNQKKKTEKKNPVSENIICQQLAMEPAFIGQQVMSQCYRTCHHKAQTCPTGWPLISSDLWPDLIPRHLVGSWKHKPLPHGTRVYEIWAPWWKINYQQWKLTWTHMSRSRSRITSMHWTVSQNDSQSQVLQLTHWPLKASTKYCNFAQNIYFISFLELRRCLKFR